MYMYIFYFWYMYMKYTPPQFSRTVPTHTCTCIYTYMHMYIDMNIHCTHVHVYMYMCIYYTSRQFTQRAKELNPVTQLTHTNTGLGSPVLRTGTVGFMVTTVMGYVCVGVQLGRQ